MILLRKLFFISLLLAAACSEDAVSDFSGRGQVLDAETGAPVEGALIELYAAPELIPNEAPTQQALTNAQGKFSFRAGTEDLKHSVVRINKAPYYASKRQNLQPDGQTYFLRPAGTFKLSILFRSLYSSDTLLTVDLLQKGQPVRDFRLGPLREYSNAYYFTVPGQVEYQLVFTLSKYPTVFQRDTLSFSVPYRDTLDYYYSP